MSPFGYFQTPPPTDADEARRTADILARTVTPDVGAGVQPAIWCCSCGSHLAESATKPCPACADAPRLEESA